MKVSVVGQGRELSSLWYPGNEGVRESLGSLSPSRLKCRIIGKFGSSCRKPVSREPRDGRCVGPSFRVRNDMADLSKNRVCCGHAAGHFVGSQGASRAIGPAGAAMGFSSTCLRLASSIGGLVAYGGTDRLIFGTLSHEQIGRTRAYVITKWRQSEIQQVKETKVPPPRTHGKVGDPVGGQCSAVRYNSACKVGAAVATEHPPSPPPSLHHGSFN